MEVLRTLQEIVGKGPRIERINWYQNFFLTMAVLMIFFTYELYRELYHKAYFEIFK